MLKHANVRYIFVFDPPLRGEPSSFLSVLILSTQSLNILTSVIIKTTNC